MSGLALCNNLKSCVRTFVYSTVTEPITMKFNVKIASIVGLRTVLGCDR